MRWLRYGALISLALCVFCTIVDLTTDADWAWNGFVIFFLTTLALKNVYQRRTGKARLGGELVETVSTHSRDNTHSRDKEGR